MPLSEHEQRLLEQMERALYAEDPKFASSLRSGPAERASRGRAALGIIVLLVGVALLIAGVAIPMTAVGVLGFVVMVIGTTLAYAGLRARPATEASADAAAAPSQPGAAKQSSGFMVRLEDRWRRRREQGPQ